MANKAAEPIKDLDDLQKLKDAIKVIDKSNAQRNLLLLELTLATALRISDVLSLTKANIRNGYIYVKTQKTGEFAKIALNPRVNEMVNVYVDALISDDSKLFDFSYVNAWKIIKKAAEWSRINKKYQISTHSLRKTAAWHLYVDSKYDIRMVQTLLGHKNVQMTEKYLSIRQDELNLVMKSRDILG